MCNHVYYIPVLYTMYYIICVLFYAYLTVARHRVQLEMIGASRAPLGKEENFSLKHKKRKNSATLHIKENKTQRRKK
jgi:hypothetical protein